MSSALSPQDHVIIHLPKSSPDWAGILAQFAMQVSDREGRLYATWAGARLAHATEKSEGLVALTPDGELLGLTLVEIVEDTAEISLPWIKHPHAELRHELAEAALQVLREEHAVLLYVRAERQLLPGEMDCRGLEAAGFVCHWRKRMALELMYWQEPIIIPEGYRLTPWNIAYLDAAAQVVYRANFGTLDAELYAPFFGESPERCRKGLLAILVGRYGPFQQDATVCAFHGDDLVGINLILDESEGQASVVEISVDPVHQGKGLGRALMNESLRILELARYERVELAVTRANDNALHLYESIGFEPKGDFPVCVLPDWQASLK